MFLWESIMPFTLIVVYYYKNGVYLVLGYEILGATTKTPNNPWSFTDVNACLILFLGKIDKDHQSIFLVYLEW